MYGSRAVTLLVLISDDVINRILKLDILTNILVYVTRCCTDLTSKVLKERTFGQSSALLKRQHSMLMQMRLRIAFKILNNNDKRFAADFFGIFSWRKHKKIK